MKYKGAAIPFTSAATPEAEIGSGTLKALAVTGESSDPNTLRTAPGAKLGLKLAPLATPAMAGLAAVPDPEVTLTVTEALGALLYVAVTVPLPTGNCKPSTASVAVAEPADPVKTAVPNEAPEIENETEPDGVVPFVEATVAVKYTTSFAATVLKLLSSERLVSGVTGGVAFPPFQSITSRYASTDPSPVA
jgi:hypothetical protein